MEQGTRSVKRSSRTLRMLRRSSGTLIKKVEFVSFMNLLTTLKRNMEAGSIETENMKKLKFLKSHSRIWKKFLKWSREQGL